MTTESVKLTDEEELGMSEAERLALADEDEELGEVEEIDDEKQKEIDDAAAQKVIDDEVAQKLVDDEARQKEIDDAEALVADPDADPEAVAAAQKIVDDAAAAADKEKDEKADDKTPVVAVDPFTPQYQAEAVENFDEKMAEITAKKDAIKQRYEDGDITVAEYIDGREEVTNEANALQRQQEKHEMSVEQAQQTGEQRWQWEQDRFFNDEANKGYKDNPLLGAAIDTAIKTLAGDEANEGKPMSWFLEEADRQVKSLFVPAPVDDGKPKDKGKENKARPKPDLSKLPPNLGNLPAAEVADTGGDEFSKLDRLSGIELETELARMPQAEADRYLKG